MMIMMTITQICISKTGVDGQKRGIPGIEMYALQLTNLHLNLTVQVSFID